MIRSISQFATALSYFPAAGITASARTSIWSTSVG